MNNNKQLTTGTIQSITDAIALELLKRGFTARLSTEQKNAGERNYHIELTSEPFQTTPVIMKEIRIDGVMYMQPEEGGNGIYVGCTVGVRYSHFSGGTNGTDLFRFSCLVREGETLYNVQVR